MMLGTRYFRMAYGYKGHVFCGRIKRLNNALCLSDKKITGTILPKEKSVVSESEVKILKQKSSDEIEKVAYENEEVILKTISTEKEREACVRSRLSKECDKLSSHKISLMSTGLNLSLEQTDLKHTSWEDYSFDRTISQLKRQCLSPPQFVSKCPEGSLGSGSSGDKRIKRGEPGKVLFACLPDEWFKFFLPKTGVTGLGTFFVTFMTYLISKEYYVLEHNFYGGLSSVVLWYGAITYVGPHMSKMLDSQIEEYENRWQKDRVDMKAGLEEDILQETFLQFQSDGQILIMDAKRENVAFQLEEEFRKRQIIAYEEVTNRLKYQVEIASVHNKIKHKNLIQYVFNEVLKSITPDMHDQMINYSIEELRIELEKKAMDGDDDDTDGSGRNDGEKKTANE